MCACLDGLCVFLFQSLKGVGIVPVKRWIDLEQGRGPPIRSQFPAVL